MWYVKSNHVHALISCIVDENKPICNIYFATEGNKGYYYCQVQNEYGEKKSLIAKVTVKIPENPINLDCSSPLISEKGLAISRIQDITSPINLESK